MEMRDVIAKMAGERQALVAIDGSAERSRCEADGCRSW